MQVEKCGGEEEENVLSRGPVGSADDVGSNGLSEQHDDKDEWRFTIPLFRGAAHAEAYKRADGKLVYKKTDGTECVMGEDTLESASSSVAGDTPAHPNVATVAAVAAEVAKFSRSHSFSGGQYRSSTPQRKEGGAFSSHTPPRPRNSMSAGRPDPSGWVCPNCNFLNWFSKKRAVCKKCATKKDSEESEVEQPHQQHQAPLTQPQPDPEAKPQRIFAKSDSSATVIDLTETQPPPAQMGIAGVPATNGANKPIGMGVVGGMGLGSTGMGMGMGMGVGGMGIGRMGGVGVGGMGMGIAKTHHRKPKRHPEKMSMKIGSTQPRHAPPTTVSAGPSTPVTSAAGGGAAAPSIQLERRPSAPPSPQGEDSKERKPERRNQALFHQSGVRKLVQSINHSLQAGNRKGVLPIATTVPVPSDDDSISTIRSPDLRAGRDRQSRREKKFLKKAEVNYKLAWEDLDVDWKRTLGQGAYGKVYKCWRKCQGAPRTGDLSALKEMTINETGCKEELMSMNLAAESELAAQQRILDTVSAISRKKELKGYHHIVTPFKPFYHDNESKLFLLMEFMHFGSLDDLLISLSTISREVSDTLLDTIRGSDPLQRLINPYAFNFMS